MNDVARQLVEQDLDEEEVAREFAQEFGIDSEDIEYEIEVTDQSDFGVEYWQVEVNRREYMAFEDWDDARSYAKQSLVQQFEDEPSLLGGVAEWVIQDNVFVGAGDIRLIAQEQGDSYAYDIDEERAVQEAGMEDEYEAAQEAGNSRRADQIVEESREKISEQIADRWKEGLKDDPIGFLVDEEGIYTKEQLLSDDVAFIQVNHDGVAEDILKNDGIGPTLASYDGAERETANLTYFRQN